jgi:hypothetical protein
MKIRSIDELEKLIAHEFAWRRKELTNLKNLSLSAKGPIQSTLLKSSVTLLYSHWEGFVKKSSIAYCEYINYQGLDYGQLIGNFSVCAVINEFQGQYPHKTFKSLFKVLNDKNIFAKSCKIDTKKYIDTGSNLNSDVLKEITQKVGVDYSLYELKENLIDERFLGLRNAVSHGEYRSISEDDFIELYTEITSLISIFKNQIINAAIQKSYLSEQGDKVA